MTTWLATQRAVALGGLILVAPLLLVLAALIKTGSSGPAIYRARRMGMGGRPITIHKLRTMRWRPDESQPAITTAADPRVTRVGRWLRRTRLDELPQLWDVVTGDMALVGPRPESPEFVDIASSDWRTVLSVRPGITGPSQLRFHDEARSLTDGDADESYRATVLPEKLRSDLAYVSSRSVRGDLAVLARTVRLAITGRAG